MQDSYHQVKNHTLYLLTAIYFLWLLAVLLIFGYTPTNDGEGYIEFAEHCLAQGQPYPTTTVYQTAPFIWNIGIINLVELSLWLTNAIWPVLLLLCLLKSLICLLTGLITKQLFNHRIAIIAMLLFMLYPNNWGQSTMISSEIPSTCLALAMVWIAVSQRNLFFGGILLALANWFRPTATIFLISIILYLIIIGRQHRLQNIVKTIAGYVVFILIVGTSCLIRTGHFVYQSRSYWFSMVDECYDGAEVAPHWNQPIWPEGTPRYIENHEEMNCFDFERIWRQRSISWLKDHPLEYFSKIPGRLYYMYQSDYDNMTVFLKDKSQPENNFITIPFKHLLSEASTLNVAQWLSLLCLLLYVCLLLMAFTGTLQLITQARYDALFLPLLIAVGGSLLLVLIMHGETRFKDPLMPFIFMLAAVGVDNMLYKLRLLNNGK